MTDPAHDRLPRRDFVIIPLLVLVTVIVLLMGAEVGARFVFAEIDSETCSIPDPIHGYRLKPDCVSYRKAAEGPKVENIYNDCGYRTRESCGPRPPGTLRMALLGASTAEGFKVSYDDAFAPRVGAALSRACGRPVELQNMGVAGYKPLDQYLRVDEALAMKPDVAMMVVVPFDFEDLTPPQRLADRDHPELLEIRPATAAAPGRRSLLQELDALAAGSRAVVAAQHFLYEDRATYVKLFMLYGDKADYLRQPFTARWEYRLAQIDLLLGGMAAKFHEANVPFVLVLGPSLIQVALLGEHDRPANVDPYALGRRLGEIAARHGVAFVDTLGDFQGVKQPSSIFYAVDGHMNAEGHAIFARAITDRLEQGDIAPLASCGAASLVAH